MSEANNNFSGASFTGVTNFGGTHYGDQTGIVHNYAPEQDLAEAARDIQNLLIQLQQSNLTANEVQKQVEMVKTVEKGIKRDPRLRDRLLNALKQGGIEALKQALDTIYKNPFLIISVETVKGFLEAEYPG